MESQELRGIVLMPAMIMDVSTESRKVRPNFSLMPTVFSMLYPSAIVWRTSKRPKSKNKELFAATIDERFRFLSWIN